MDVKELRKLNEAFLKSVLKRTDGLLFNLDASKIIDKIPDSFVDMIYFDPPFSNKIGIDIPHKEDRTDFKSMLWFVDEEKSFISTTQKILEEFKRVLKPSGSVFLHLPWDLAYQIRPVADSVFGKGALRNEIIWTWRAWPSKSSHLEENHHTILWYTKSLRDEHYFEPLSMPRAKSTVKRFGNGKIVSAVDRNGDRKPSKTKGKSTSSPLNDVWVWDTVRGDWLYELDEIDERGYIESTRKLLGIGHEAPVKKVKASSSGVSYPWQKPVKLLERLISMTVPKEGLVMDLFAGTGSTGVASKNLKRKYLLSEISRYTTWDMIQRLKYSDLVPGFPLFNHPGIKDRASVDGKQFQFWCGYTLGGISDDANRGRDSVSGIDIYIPSQQEASNYIPAEVKKKFSKDEWYKTKGKAEKLFETFIGKRLYSLVSLEFDPQVRYESQKVTNEKYEVVDLSERGHQTLLRDKKLLEIRALNKETGLLKRARKAKQAIKKLIVPIPKKKR